jgi:hypothetical protein
LLSPLLSREPLPLSAPSASGASGTLCLVETIPLADGDLRWVFPGLDETGEVLTLVRQADLQIRQLAEHFAVRASWTGSGIEFHRLERGQASLFGSVEPGEVSFVAQLWFPRRCGWDQRVGPPWEVDGEISVRCDAAIDCGLHLIEDMSPRQFDSPLEAARALLKVATWLRLRGTAEPLGSWRQRDSPRGHH